MVLVKKESQDGMENYLWKAFASFIENANLFLPEESKKILNIFYEKLMPLSFVQGALHIEDDYLKKQNEKK